MELLTQSDIRERRDGKALRTLHQSEMERCRREIAAMQAQEETAPAWLVTLGITDWEWELEYLELKNDNG